MMLIYKLLILLIINYLFLLQCNINNQIYMYVYWFKEFKPANIRPWAEWISMEQVI